jgi:hypothetical protein
MEWNEVYRSKAIIQGVVMPRMKIKEALRLIREKGSKKPSPERFSNEWWEKKRLAKIKREQRKRQEQLNKYISGTVKELEPDWDKKAYRIYKVCKCGRKFYVWSHTKQRHRRRCSVCKPY